MVSRRQAGHALLVALVILLLAASAATMIAAHFGFRARLVSQESRRIHLVAMTDAAVAESLAGLDQSSGFAGVIERPFGGGRIASAVTSLRDNRRLILATARYRGWSRRVEVRVELESTGLVVESWAALPPDPH
jgi:hypothetical protein